MTLHKSLQVGNSLGLESFQKYVFKFLVITVSCTFKIRIFLFHVLDFYGQQNCSLDFGYIMSAKIS